MIIKVAVASPFPEPLDYLAEEFADRVEVGMRVVVPFQRGQKVGIITEVNATSSLAQNKLKGIAAVLPEHKVSDDVLQLLKWAANYYHYPIGQAAETALPAGLRRIKPMQLPTPQVWQLTEKGLTVDLDSLKRAPKQQKVLRLLAEQAMDAITLNSRLDDWRASIKRLVELGYVEVTTPVQTKSETIASEFKLNDEQELAVKAIIAKENEHHTFLIHGITGSGKTEVYLSIVESALKQDKQCLLLVPEIGLTPQTVQRFSKRFGNRVACLHSALSDGERILIWQDANEGKIDVLIGTRSALFTPFKNLGLIIVDEEHDQSFKQQDGFRYHARDCAIYRAHILNIPIVLGSATPSFESLQNAKQGRYEYLTLNKRAGKAKPPLISVVDSGFLRNHESLTPTLIEDMQAHLERGEQVLLFLNRRGFSPTLMCGDCKAIFHCHRCDAKLTYHDKKQQLVCHHCGYECRKPSNCASCNSENLVPVGSGTERLEEELERHFADYNCIRIDRDTTRRKGALEDHLKSIRDGKAQILIGTQMLAKGHDFPNVTLVGLVNIDQGLYSLDYRGPEYMAQLIVQVAGRSGRGEKPGKVIIQSAMPDHPLLMTLIKQGFNAFSEEALSQRLAAKLPPFGHSAIIRAESPIQSNALRYLSSLAALIKHMPIDILGPATAPMEKRAGRYRAQLSLQNENRKDLHHAITLINNELKQNKALQKQARNVRWSIDIDPTDIF